MKISDQNTSTDHMGITYRTSDGRSIIDAMNDIWIAGILEKVTGVSAKPDLRPELERLASMLAEREAIIAQYERPTLTVWWRVTKALIRRGVAWVESKLSAR